MLVKLFLDLDIKWQLTFFISCVMPPAGSILGLHSRDFHVVASLADALLARHAIFGEERLRDEPKERLPRRLAMLVFQIPTDVFEPRTETGS